MKGRQLIAAAIWGLLLGAALTLLLNGPVRFGRPEVPEAVYLTATARSLASVQPVARVSGAPSAAPRHSRTPEALAATPTPTTSATPTASAAPTLSREPVASPGPTATQPATSTPIPTVSPTPTPTASPALSPELDITPQSTLPPTAPPTASSTRTYTIQPSDNLYDIALQFGVTVRALTEANGIKSTTILRPGMVLVIPIPGASPQAPSATPLPASPPEPTLTASATPLLTPSSTPTAASQVRTPVPTSTAGITPLPAPTLLAPLDGAVFSDRDEIDLSWQPVGPLPEDAYYVVTVAYIHLGDTWYDETPWTKDTSWRLSDHSYLLSLSDDGSFRWWIQVMRQSGIDEEERPTGIALSARSEIWNLIWKGEDAGPAEGTPLPPPP